jgi:hypothetical protein
VDLQVSVHSTIKWKKRNGMRFGCRRITASLRDVTENLVVGSKTWQWNLNSKIFDSWWDLRFSRRRVLKCVPHQTYPTDEDDSVLGYCAVYFHRSWPTFQRCVLPSSSDRWLIRYAAHSMLLNAVCLNYSQTQAPLIWSENHSKHDIVNPTCNDVWYMALYRVTWFCLIVSHSRTQGWH